MQEILQASVHFPTVLFTVGLGIAVVYWLFVLLGALDIDLLGGGDASGAAKGIGEALAAGKGAGEAVAVGADAGGAGPGDVASAAKSLHGGEQGGGLWHGLGLASVPITISLTLVFLLGWVSSLLATHYLGTLVVTLGGWLTPAVLVGVLLVVVPLSGQLVRPLAPFFRIRGGKSNQDYVGATCTITTGHVDAGFGQATVEDGGTVLVIPVRCDGQAGRLARGQQAIIIEFDRTRQAYVVEPAESILSSRDRRVG